MGLQFWYSSVAHGYIVADSLTGDMVDTLDTPEQVADKFGDIVHVMHQCREGCEADGHTYPHNTPEDVGE